MEFLVENGKWGERWLQENQDFVHGERFKGNENWTKKHGT